MPLPPTRSSTNCEHSFALRGCEPGRRAICGGSGGSASGGGGGGGGGDGGGGTGGSGGGAHVSEAGMQLLQPVEQRVDPGALELAFTVKVELPADVPQDRPRFN